MLQIVLVATWVCPVDIFTSRNFENLHFSGFGQVVHTVLGAHLGLKPTRASSSKYCIAKDLFWHALAKLHPRLLCRVEDSSIFKIRAALWQCPGVLQSELVSHTAVMSSCHDDDDEHGKNSEGSEHIAILVSKLSGSHQLLGAIAMY